MECEYCKKTLSTLSNLNYHKKTNKRCFSIRKQQELEYSKIILNELNDLKKELHDKEAVIKQNEAVIKQKDEIIKQKDEIIKELAIKSVSAPKTTKTTVIKNNNTTTNNNTKYEFLAPFDLTSEYIRKKVNESFTEEYFLKGQRGVASFTYDNLIKDESNGKQKYYCTDLSRKVFVYSNYNTGKIMKDYKSNNLTKLIAGDIINKSQCLYKDGIETIKEKEEETKSSSSSSSMIFKKSMVYLNNLSDIESIKVNNEGFVRVLCGLVCNTDGNNNTIMIKDKEEDDCDEEEEEIIYVIEDLTEKEEEEDLSKYTPEYFARKEALIEREYRENSMYKLFKRQLEEERARYGGEKNRE